VIKHFLSKQFLAFLAVGGLAALLHWLARVLLSIWLPFSWAVVAAYAVGMSVAFLLNSFFVFSKSEKAKHKQARDFVVVNFSFFPLVWFASLKINAGFQAVGIVRHSEELAHAIAVALPMIATFLLYKFFAFKDSQYEPQ